ncbi:MAG: elongation factor G [Phycisphaerae bacterium]|nr:elongation factor G [Phycisphaerae bacterium]
MSVRNPADIRNVLICGTPSSGKTTLVERLLHSTGASKRLGTVEEGNTHSDFTDEERHHRHSIHPAFFTFEVEKHLVNLIDTPGRADFLGQAVACFPAVETVAVVIDPLKGVDSVARRLMAIAEARQIPRIIIVNKIDESHADLEATVASIRENFGSVCLPINLPAPGKGSVINVFEHDGSDDAGDQTEFSSVREAHKQIIEQVVEVDDELTGIYLDQGEKFDADRLHAAFEKCLEQAHLVPICFCSAKTGAGVDDLLHVFASLCPSPVEVNPPEFVRRDAPDADEQEWHPTPDPAGKILAHVFKITTDSFLGKTGVFRVWQGTVRAKSELFLDDQKKSVKIGHLFKLQGREHVEVQEVGPGEIAAVAKVEEVRFNSVLHDTHDLDSVRLKPLQLPKPMFGLAIELKNHADENKFSTIAHRFIAEDPCLVIDRVAATKQTVMRGLGELHLRIVIEKLKNGSNIELITSQPKVAYKETITARADGHHRHKKQTGGAGQFGEVYLRIEPLPPDHPEGFEFESEVVGGSVPRQFWPAVEKGVRQIVADGAVAGYPMTGIRCVLYDGKYHDVDSKEIAFITAGKRAFVDAVAKARPKLLEPYVNIEITAPARYMGDLAGHIATKRGRIQSSDVVGENCVVRAVAPLGELQTYSNELKSMTGGAGSFAMDYSHDEHAPANVQAAAVAAFKPGAEED